jgi:energy-converting hydrogenase Eha subunit A
LVLLPMGLDLAARGSAVPVPNQIWKVVTAVQVPAALLLGVAYFLPQGLLAGSLALPWFMTTALIALCGLIRVWRRGLRPRDEVCLDAGLIFLAVGGAWAVSDRLGFRPLDFESVIVLLTAIHFHYAGFILPIVTGLAIQHVRGRMANWAGAGVIAAVPLVAVGITATQLQLGPQIECLAAWLMAVSGGLAAWLHIRLAMQPVWPSPVRGLWAISTVSLFASMILAAMYGSRFYLPLAWLDIPKMRGLHGTANAIGFAFADLLAWSLATNFYRGLPHTAPVLP